MPAHNAKKLLQITLLIFMAATASAQPVRILFDATKGEMAGNADWVIDADQTNLGVGSGGTYVGSPGHQSNPQQIPTPAQSAITSATAETYWTGALSSWAVDCVNRGYEVVTLPWNGQITYGNAGNAQDLSNYQVYVIDEPNLKFNATEKTAIVQYVQHGGSLFIISDHDGSDRNGDGWDSPAIWNDLLSTNSVQPNPFGITFDLADFSQTTTNVSAAATDSIIHGPMGNVTKAQWSGGTSMTLDPTANPTVKGVIFPNGAVPGNTEVMVAYARYGSGKVAAMGDSSPADDGTGNPNCVLYNGYLGDASGNHRLLIMNMTIWLAGRVATTAVSTVADEAHIRVYPNPATGTVSIETDKTITHPTVTVYNLSGARVYEETRTQLDKNEQLRLSLEAGFYVVKVAGDATVETCKIVVY